MRLARREFLQLGAASLAAGLAATRQCLAGTPSLEWGGRDFSPESFKERKAVPSACWQCVARDGIVGFVEDGRLVKIEGNPLLPRTNGRICARGQAGHYQAYDPDRLLYPMRRVGERGGGKWKRVSWDEALEEIVARLRRLRDAGHPERFMFHYGRMKASSSKIIKSHFLAAFGTKTIGNHTAICEGGKWTAQELTWGKHYDVNDVARTHFILVFGCNPLEAHTSHVPLAQRIVDARARGVPMVTFDVRLSNTAAKSDEWIPIRPATDGAVALAMANVVMAKKLYDRSFIERWTNVTVDEIEEHVKPYTPEWAEQVSGVPASSIHRIAERYARAKPGTIISYRGAIAHWNGVQTERAILMLEAICGNIDVPGGRVHAVGAKWKNSFRTPKGKAKKLDILDGEGIAYPSHHVCESVIDLIAAGKHGRPEVYMFYCYNPIYVNGDIRRNIERLKDESLFPFVVGVDVAMGEATALADLILPDATYLERWDWEDMVSMDMIPEYYIRQPMIEPLGEARDFKDVCCEMARRLGGEVAAAMPFASAAEFVRDACEHTPGVKDAGGFEMMRKRGAWVDPKAEPKYRAYAEELDPEKLEGAILDAAAGVYWKGKPGESYTTTKSAYKKYVGQKVGDKVYAGFKPDKLNKSGLFEIRSNLLEAKGFSGLPDWKPVPDHESRGKNELILTTYKVAVQTHSRTQNCKYLTEIYHRNPAWLHPETARARGIADGDTIRVRSSVGEIVTTAKVTEGVHPDVVAISNHCGHWEYGRWASGKTYGHSKDDPDTARKWWDDNGEHPNWIIPNAPDPIAGQQRAMDTVVTVEKV
ncbi:MAG: molybdopterin-dependent oxidoreductase [Candidatus Krumholzibacteriia bacterium]